MPAFAAAAGELGDKAAAAAAAEGMKDADIPPLHAGDRRAPPVAGGAGKLGDKAAAAAAAVEMKDADLPPPHAGDRRAPQTDKAAAAAEMRDNDSRPPRRMPESAAAARGQGGGGGEVEMKDTDSRPGPPAPPHAGDRRAPPPDKAAAAAEMRQLNNAIRFLGSSVLGISSWHPTSSSSSSSCSNSVTLCSFVRSRNTQARGRRKRTLDHATHKRARAQEVEIKFLASHLGIPLRRRLLLLVRIS